MLMLALTILDREQAGESWRRGADCLRLLQPENSRMRVRKEHQIVIMILYFGD